jgi:ribosomal-protein-alanine N-acetyltransferase
MPQVELTTERLALTTLGPEAAEPVAAYLRRNWSFFQPFMPGVAEEYFTEPFQRERLEREERQRSEQAAYRFWLFASGDARREHILGDVGLSNIVWGAFLSCHLGYKVAQAATNRGYTTEAVRAVVRYAFDELRLHRVEANIMPHNTPSRRVVEKLGFVNEGSSPQYLKIAGVWEEHIHYVLLNPDV